MPDRVAMGRRFACAARCCVCFIVNGIEEIISNSRYRIYKLRVRFGAPAHARVRRVMTTSRKIRCTLLECKRQFLHYRTRARTQSCITVEPSIIATCNKNSCLLMPPIRTIYSWAIFIRGVTNCLSTLISVVSYDTRIVCKRKYRSPPRGRAQH